MDRSRSSVVIVANLYARNAQAKKVLKTIKNKEYVIFVKLTGKGKAKIQVHLRI